MTSSVTHSVTPTATPAAAPAATHPIPNSVHTDRPSPTRRDPGLAGWLCLLFAALASTVLLLGDPYWLSLPLHVVAIGVGAAAIHRGQVHHFGTQFGLNLAVFVLFIWVLWRLSPLVIAM